MLDHPGIRLVALAAMDAAIDTWLLVKTSDSVSPASSRSFDMLVDVDMGSLKDEPLSGCAPSS